MKLLKFKEFLNEDIVPLGFGMTSRPSYYTLSSNNIRTGYDMMPVAGPMVTASDSIANSAIDHENNDNPDHTGRGYINEALKVFKEKCNEAYESKCNEAKVTNESALNENKFSTSGFTFTIIGSQDAKGSYLQFIPDGKTVDTYSKEEMANFIEKYFNNMDYFRDCMTWDKGHNAAGIIFRINASYLADSLLKEFKR